ncbi:S8 family serine peptidase [Kitasatospora sp. MAP5-34]|uniref:S8 family serine peptidase n=1 Tax=Kitasatospora sp. MAP5-34 TaxID=3035102 RepID=UPI0024761B26|nr:S8 family serine peptidase [Kitasatospora sp. MAP5-34]MDH6577170.1 type VII secretion-associated serine protease mycosin [Kitasatospora sp. MAP5-34]
MTLTRTLRALSATALAGSLLLTAAPAASADQVRDAQWVNQYFNLDKVWSVSRGDGVIVAVIDSGVDANHADLTGQVLPGYDLSGKGLVTHPTNPHGTSMASEIAGHGHGSGAGMLGLAPGAKILPVYEADADGHDAVPADIHWAVDNGAKVISISLGGGQNPKVAEAVGYAAQHDVLIVAAAGNEGKTSVDYPGAEPGVVAVGAVDKHDMIWSQSNAGPEVMLSAPGVDVVSAGACDGQQYCMASGTSDATAYVSATAALVRAKFPNLTAGQVANRLVKSALVPSALAGAQLPDEHYGYGVVRPYEALTQDIPVGSAQGPLAKTAGSGDSGGGTATPGGAVPGTANPTPGALPQIASSSSSVSKVLYVGGFGVLLLAVLVAVIVVVARRRRTPGAGQAGPAPYGTPPGWQPQGQQHYPNQPQPPYGNQPQQPYPNQSQAPYGNQAPPPGYPPQQPYQNPYGPGGNQPR